VSSRKKVSGGGGRRAQRLAIDKEDGTRLSAIDFGGSGQTCLLVHGAGLNASCFAPLASALAETLHCVGIDLSGHGHSEEPSHVDWSVFVDDVLAASRSLGSGLIGVGHSLGATALLGAAASDPASLAALICYEPIVIDQAMPDRPPSAANAAGARRRRAEFPSRQQALEHFSTRPPFTSFDRAALAGYLEEGLLDDGDGSLRLACRPETEAAIYETAAAFDVLGLLDRVDCPVTVAFGDSSDVMSGAGAEVVAERLGHAQIASLKGLDHFGPFDSPLLVAEMVVRQLRTPEA
jgi:pimeloyl-ACP methyl ester carboxylesterase